MRTALGDTSDILAQGGAASLAAAHQVRGPNAPDPSPNPMSTHQLVMLRTLLCAYIKVTLRDRVSVTVGANCCKVGGKPCGRVISVRIRGLSTVSREVELGGTIKVRANVRVISKFIA